MHNIVKLGYSSEGQTTLERLVKQTLLGHHLIPHLPPYSTKVIFRLGWLCGFELGLSAIRGIDSLSSENLRKERAYNFTNSIAHTSAILEVNYFKMDLSDFQTSWSPYMFAGLSYLKFRDLYYDTNEQIASYQANDFSVAIPIGVGIKTRLGMSFVLGFEIKALYTFSDNLDGSFPKFVDGIDKQPAFGNNLSNDWMVFTGFSLTYSFGRGWFIEGLL